jgi:predicted O-linked N-acetylglucosamine transferase (SPINDLY family)
MTHEEFLAAHGRVDIALDTFPYHGTTTTCFSLWMGLPIVTLAGSTHVSRVGVTLLSDLGRPEWIAHSADDYVEIAKALSSSLPDLAAIRSQLRQQMLDSPITDGVRGGRALESALRQMWVTWCASR